MLNNDKEIVATLEQKGWVCKRDQVGDWFCILDLGDRQVQVIPALKTAPDYQTIAFNETISTRKFTDAVNRIMQERNVHEPFFRPWNSEFTRKADHITIRDVFNLITGILEWAKNQDIEKILKEYSARCPDRPGQKQLYHLAALAIAGDVKTLEVYEANFLKGDTLNFVPMITLDIIKRTVEFAKSIDDDR